MTAKSLALMLYLLIFSQITFAEKLYAELGTTYNFTKIDNLNFSQIALETRIGYYFIPQIGAEFHVAKGLTDDTKKGLTTELDYNTGIGVRFESPVINQARVFITLGYSQTVLSMTKQTSSFPGDGTFNSPSAGIGGEIITGKIKNLSIYGKYTHLFDQDGVRISSIGLGAKYDF